MMNTADDASRWITEADDQSFQSAAVERSRETVVVVDFWAEWCQPCRMLSPLLEKFASADGGKWLLVKVDIDKAPGVAAGFGVQSIPAVFALRDGQLFDSFVGLLPEEQLCKWIDSVLPSPAQELLAAGRKLAATDAGAAEADYRRAIELDANLAAAKIALAELLIEQRRHDEARHFVDELDQRGFLEPEAEKVKAALHMAEGADKAGDLDKLRAAVAADPKDLRAKLDLAQALAAAKQHQQALQTALEVVETQHKEFVDPARGFMVDLFRVLGDENQLVGEYRRKLSTALY